MGASPRPEARSATREIDEETPLGEVYMSALVRSQLRSGLALLGVVVLVTAGLPLLFVLLPDVADHTVGPVTVAWLLLAVGAFPALFAAAWWQVRSTERIERDFTDMMHRQS
jgi:hypothetical protein